jgi:hypothetical protein
MGTSPSSSSQSRRGSKCGSVFGAWQAPFATGYVTFDQSGRAIWSRQLDAEIRASFGLGDGEVRLRGVTDGHLRYLAHHRLHVYRGGR